MKNLKTYKYSIIVVVFLVLNTTTYNCDARDTSNVNIIEYKIEALENQRLTDFNYLNNQIKLNETHIIEVNELMVNNLQDKINIYIAVLIGFLSFLGFTINYFGKRAIIQWIEKNIENRTLDVLNKKLSGDYLDIIVKEKAEIETKRLIQEFEKKGGYAIDEFKEKSDKLFENISKPNFISNKIDTNSSNNEIKKSNEQKTINELFELAYNSLNPNVQISLYDRIIELDPMNESAYNNIAVSYQNVNKYEQSIKYLDKALEINPNFEMAYGNRANAYNQLDNLEKAIIDSKLALEINPKYVQAYSVLGNVYTKKGDEKTAFEMLNKATEIDPNSSQAYFNRAYFYDSLAKYDEAEKDYIKSEQLGFGNKPMIYNNMAVLYRHKKEYNKAIEYIEKARIINPNFPNTEGTMALIYSDMGDEEKFYEHLELALNNHCPVWNYLSDPGFNKFRESDRLNNLLKKYQKS